MYDTDDSKAPAADRDPDGPPQTKRRRVGKAHGLPKAPKMPGKGSRTTKRVNLIHASRFDDHEDQLCLDQLLHALKRHKKIVVIAGAGISVSAGSK